MQLEQTLERYQPMQMQIAIPEQRRRVYTIVDLESLSASALYTPKIKMGDGGISIPYGNLGIPELRDIHDTFKLDRYGNLYSGHTTFNDRFRINTDPLRSRDDDILGK